MRGRSRSSVTYVPGFTRGVGRVMLDTYKDNTNATATTASVNAAIAECLQSNYTLFAPAGDYLINPVTTISDQLVIEGAGEQQTRFYANAAGDLFKQDCALASSTGKGIRFSNFSINSTRATSAAGDRGIYVTNTGAFNNAFVWLSELVIEGGFHDHITLDNCYFSTIENCYLGDYRRYGVRYTNQQSVDVGDHHLDNCKIQPKQAGGGGFDSAGSNVRLEQFAGSRITNCKIFPGHAIGLHAHPNATYVTESFPTLMFHAQNNNFDSFGDGNNAIVLEGIWATGVSGETQHGNKLANVLISGNTGSNVGRLLEIRSKVIYDVGVFNNVCTGGGGIKITAGAVVDGLAIDGNLFDNRAITTTLGASNSGIGPDKAIENLGTVNGFLPGMNFFYGFLTASDLVSVNDPQDANKVYAGPTTGADAAPTFRTVVAADLAATGTPSSTTFLRGDLQWATPSAGGSTFDPSATSERYEDCGQTLAFMGPASGLAVVAGSASTGAYGATDGSVLHGHPGVHHGSLGTNGTAGYTNYVRWYEANGWTSVGDGEVWIEADFKMLTALPDATDDYHVHFGFHVASLVEAASNDGALMTLDSGNANWICKTTNGSATTSTTTTSAPAANTWYRLRVTVNADRTSVTFKVDGTTVATHTTNLPRATTVGGGLIYNPQLAIIRLAGTTNRVCLVDYFWYKKTLTTAR